MKSNLPTGQEWQKAKESYQEALELKAKKSKYKIKSEIINLDTFTHSIGDVIKNRTPRHLTRNELLELTKWKLLRGKFRPGFLKRIESNNSEELVIQVSTQAFEKLTEPITLTKIADAIVILNTLHGVAFATSSLVISTFVPSCPFMEDLALDLVTPSTKKIDYSKATFLKLYQLVAKLQSEGVEGSALEITDWIWSWNYFEK
jgi:hypothetical protein